MARDKSFNYVADYSVFGIQPVNPRIGFDYHREVLSLKNLPTLKEYLINADYASIDTETTSLECASTQLISVNFSVRVETEIKSYVAFYDTGYCESWFKGKLDKLPSRYEILKCVKLALNVKKSCIFHNISFDRRVLLLSTKKDKLFDVLTMAEQIMPPVLTTVPLPYNDYDFMHCTDNWALWFQMDSNVLKGLGLKELGKTYLGLPMEHFDEAVGLDILNSEPRQLLDYGALDTYSTLSLYLYAYPRFKAKCPLLARLLPEFSNALYDLEEVIHPVSKQQFEYLLEDVTQEIEKVKQEFYTNYRVINLGSAQQKSDLLMELGWSTGVFNAPKKDGTPVMSTKAEHLEKIAKQGCDAARLMIRYNELIKFQSSYCKAPLEQITDPITGETRPWRWYIYENKAPTLRLASGKYTVNRKPYRYFAPLNGMALPKPAQVLRGLDYDPYNYTFKFYPDKETDKGQFLVETYSDKFNMRAAFVPPSPGYICVKCDYSSEEVRMQACESNERVWIDAFKNHKDIYWVTACSIYGVDPNSPKDRTIRKNGKTAVLSGAYAKPGSYYTYQEKLGMPQQEAIEFEAKLRGGVPNFTAWKLKTYQIGRVQGYIQNRYGHIRSVRRYLETHSKHYMDYADKTVVSESIQGLAGIITRIFCVKFWKLLYGPNRKYNKNCQTHEDLMDPAKCEVSWLIPIHDEIQFFCRKDLVVPFLHEVKAIMEGCTPPSYEIPLEAAPEIGPDFGHLVEVHFATDENGNEILLPDEEPRPGKEEKVEVEEEVDLSVSDDETEEMGGLEF